MHVCEVYCYISTTLPAAHSLELHRSDAALALPCHNKVLLGILLGFAQQTQTCRVMRPASPDISSGATPTHAGAGQTTVIEGGMAELTRSRVKAGVQAISLPTQLAAVTSNPDKKVSEG